MAGRATVPPARLRAPRGQLSGDRVVTPHRLNLAHAYVARPAAGPAPVVAVADADADADADAVVVMPTWRNLQTPLPPRTPSANIPLIRRQILRQTALLGALDIAASNDGRWRRAPPRSHPGITDFLVSNRTETRDPMGDRVKAAGNTDDPR